MKKRTTKDFIAEAKLVHANKYDYSQTEYTKKDNKVKILCPEHGLFEQIAHSHLRGYGCKKCSKFGIAAKTNDKFIVEANQIHGNIYNYSLVEYVNKNKKIEIICKNHGSFKQTPHNHLAGSGCPKCGRENQISKRKKDFSTFEVEAKRTHKDFYLYSTSNYINSHTKINIICPIHGVFEQLPYSHIAGQGCPLCANTLKQQNAPSWTLTNWLNAAEKSVNFDSFKLYVIHCFNENESFIKIGRTYNKLSVRFSSGQLPYNYSIIKVIESKDGSYIYNLENRVKRKLKPYKYIPSIKFGGMYECFKK